MLYNPAADKPTPIIASVTFDGQRHKVYVGISIVPQHWNKDDQKALTRGYAHTNNSSVRADSRPVYRIKNEELKIKNLCVRFLIFNSLQPYTSNREPL